tara:strand:+ start:16507 stop:16686 length:180 start_codon:yes stop_codon:yes gene_type:complete
MEKRKRTYLKLELNKLTMDIKSYEIYSVIETLQKMGLMGLMGYTDVFLINHLLELSNDD